MSQFAVNIIIYITSFLVIWAGSGLLVGSVYRLSIKLKVPTFFLSFVVLGFLTSTTEIAVGFSALKNGTPGIFVGNLLGGIPVIFLLLIPLLAILGRGIRLNHNLNQASILLAILVSLSPFIVVLDRSITYYEAVALILCYVIAVFILRKEVGNKKHPVAAKINSKVIHEVLKIVAGSALVIYSSNIIVGKTIYFSEVFKIAPFYISLIVLSLGTNLPEMSVAVRAIITGRKDVVLGDYLGSASVNAFLMGVFTLMSKDGELKVENFISMFVVVCFGMVLFFHFVRTKNSISIKEGFVLVVVYLIFVATEFAPNFLSAFLPE